MDKTKCTLTGTLAKIHGYKGGFILRLKSGLSDDIIGTEMVFIEIKGLLVPFFISPGNIEVRDSNSLFIKFDSINDNSKAKDFIGCNVYLEKINQDSFNEKLDFQNYIGFEVLDSKIGKIGQLKEILSITSNPVLKISYNEKEILVPARESFLVSVDYNRKYFILQLPDGLIDLYM